METHRLISEIETATPDQFQSAIPQTVQRTMDLLQRLTRPASLGQEYNGPSYETEHPSGNHLDDDTPPWIWRLLGRRRYVVAVRGDH